MAMGSREPYSPFELFCMLVRDTFGGNNACCLGYCCQGCNKSAYLSFLFFMTAINSMTMTLITYLIFGVGLPRNVAFYASLPLGAQAAILGTMWCLSHGPAFVAVMYVYRLDRTCEEEITDELLKSLERYPRIAYGLYALFASVVFTWATVLFITVPEYDFIQFLVYILSNVVASLINMNYNQMKRAWAQRQIERAMLNV